MGQSSRELKQKEVGNSLQTRIKPRLKTHLKHSITRYSAIFIQNKIGVEVTIISLNSSPPVAGLEYFDDG
jgi:hypothetical protein